MCIINNNNYALTFINLLLFIWLFEERIQMYIYILTVQTLFDSSSDYCIEVSLIPEKEHAF